MITTEMKIQFLQKDIVSEGNHLAKVREELPLLPEQSTLDSLSLMT